VRLQEDGDRGDVTLDLKITGTVESLHLEPGDRIIVTLDPATRLGDAQVGEIKKQLEEEFGDHRVVVLRGLRLSKATP
jgi:hypothetical protein